MSDFLWCKQRFFSEKGVWGRLVFFLSILIFFVFFWFLFGNCFCVITVIRRLVGFVAGGGVVISYMCEEGKEGRGGGEEEGGEEVA